MQTRTHGTLACYIAGCRRPECKAANAAYHRTRRDRLRLAPPIRIDDLLVECWCTAACVWVSPELVRAGVTGSCARGCMPEAVAS